MIAASTRKPPTNWLRVALIAGAALLLLWLSVAISIAGATRDLRPDFALRLWPIDGSAQAALADRLLLTNPTDPAARAQAEALAKAALAREPTSIRAARILATLTADPRQMQARFEYARRLSRRDLLTNLWFIEAAVQRDDVAAALAQYDVALRTSSRAPQVLFPILNAAMAQVHLQAPIAELLATGSHEWVPDFADYALAEASQIGNLGRVIIRNPAILAQLRIPTQARLVALLADQRLFDVGGHIYRTISGRTPAGPGDMALAMDGEWPPYDWRIASAGDHGAAQGAEGLRFFSRSGSRAAVARRLIRLPVGTYALRSIAVAAPNTGAGSASWSVVCARGREVMLAALPLGDNPAAGASFRVPAGCDWQWLTLEVSSEPDGARFEIDIASVQIVSAR